MLDFACALALLVGGGVILLGLILGWWISARVTHPIEQLAAGAREVAGNWSARVQLRSRDEIGQLAMAFNEMTREIAEQRERLVQLMRGRLARTGSQARSRIEKSPVSIAIDR